MAEPVPLHPQLDFWRAERSGHGRRLRWSVSRYKRYQSCLRRYYYIHVALRGVKPQDQTPEQKHVSMLRTLRNRYMWVGEIVHQLVELAFRVWREGSEVPVEALVERGTRLMRAQYAESMQHLYRERPRKAVGLVEHAFDLPVSREEWQRRRDHMQQCIEHFFSLELVAHLRELPDWRWLALETAGSYVLGDARVTVKPDAAWREEDDRVVMLDWKTGQPRPDDEWLQLAVYGVFAQRSWRLGADHFHGVTVYLSDGKIKHWTITEDELRKAEEMIEASTQHMLALEADGAIESFPKTEDPEHCALCPYQRLCGRDAKAAAGPIVS